MKEARQPAIFQFKLTLAGVTPPIVRTIQISEETTLPELHRYVQAVMNWENYHLHEFVVNGRRYGDPSTDEDIPSDVKDERRVRLSKIVKGVGDQIEYLYDFGDGWEHDLLLEAILLPDPDALYPRCIAAKRNAPPEDSGGPFGYQDYLDALADRMHENHREMRDWHGPFDPEFCSLDLLNERLKIVASRTRMPELEPVFTSPYAKMRTTSRTVEIELTERERDLIVNHTHADEHLITDLQVKSKQLVKKYVFGWEDLDDLAGYVAAESNQARNKKLSAEWSRIYEKLTAALQK